MQTQLTSPRIPPSFTPPIALWVVGSVLVGMSLIAHNLAQAAKPAGPFAIALADPNAGAAEQVASLIDHSSLASADLLPEPNAALLHSDPNEYVQLASLSW